MDSSLGKQNSEIVRDRALILRNGMIHAIGPGMDAARQFQTCSKPASWRSCVALAPRGPILQMVTIFW
jgi:hypothetical protein